MKRKKITLDLQKLIIVIIYFSVIFFNGGVCHKLDIGGLNSYFDLIFILFYLIMPVVSSYILLNYFNNNNFSFSIQPLSFIIGAFVFLFILINNISHQNLFADEYYYTTGCFKLVSAFINNAKLDEISLFKDFSYSSILRMLLGTLWFGSFLFLKYILNHPIKIKRNKIFYFWLFAFKLFLLLGNTVPDVHPPLNYFSTSIFIVIFGLKIISIKSSIIFVNVLLIIYLYNRLKLSEISVIFISIFIFSTPIIENFSIVFDQAIYSMICFSVVVIEIFYKKIKPKYLILIISIFSLFRYSSIAAYPAALVYCFFYYNTKIEDWENIIKKIVSSLTPIFLSIPVLLIPILVGTPTTDKIHEIDIGLIHLLQFQGSLTEDILDVFNRLLLIPLVSFFLLFLSKKAKILIFIFAIYFSYLLIYNISNPMADAPKYLLEQIGFVYVFSFTFLINKFYNLKQLNHNLKISLLVLCSIAFSIYNFYDFSKLSHQNHYEKYYGYWFRNNNHNYALDYIKTNNLYDKSLLIGIDYAPMFLSLSNTTISEFQSYIKNWSQYKYLQKKYGVDWTYIDIDIINKLENIEYLFISDFFFDYNQNNIEKLISTNKWEIIGKVKKTIASSNFCIIKRLP